jgi:hypothetical protein
LAKTFCGSSPNHLPHKTEKKTLGSQMIYLTFAQSFTLETYIIEPLEGKFFYFYVGSENFYKGSVQSFRFFNEGPNKRSSLQKT